MSSPEVEAFGPWSSPLPVTHPYEPRAGNRTPIPFPKNYKQFPRTAWATANLASPPFERDFESLEKSEWCGCQASKRWTRAFTARSLEGMDKVDLALAVFDKASQLNTFVRYYMGKRGILRTSTEDWILDTDEFIKVSFLLAKARLTLVFPNDPAMQQLTNDDTCTFAMGFARTALNWAWLPNADSADDHPPTRRVSHRIFFDRYMPDPATLTIHYTKADPYNLLPDVPDYVWINADGEPVNPPEGESEWEVAAERPTESAQDALQQASPEPVREASTLEMISTELSDESTPERDRLGSETPSELTPEHQWTVRERTDDDDDEDEEDERHTPLSDANSPLPPSPAHATPTTSPVKMSSPL